MLRMFVEVTCDFCERNRRVVVTEHTRSPAQSALTTVRAEGWSERPDAFRNLCPACAYKLAADERGGA